MERSFIFADTCDLEEGTDEDAFHERHLKYIDGHQWRMLSSGISGCLPGPEFYNESTCKCAQDITIDLEAQSGVEAFKALKNIIRKSSTTNDLLDVDLKAAGEFLRYARDRIEKGEESVPEQVLNFVDEAVPLRKSLCEGLGFNFGE